MHSELSRYFEKYPAHDAPFMHRQIKTWSQDKPLKDLHIVHHVPVVTNTLLKIACLIEAGAIVTVTNPSSFVKPDPIAIASLQASGIRYIEDPQALRGETFDLFFDCGAALFQALGRPRIGAIELTASGDQFYRRSSLDFPVISIDRTLTKQLETIFGSAESAQLAIAQETQCNPAQKAWLIFGFGKIGRGLAYFCVQNKAPVTIVERCPNARAEAQALGLQAIDADDIAALESAMKQSDIVITATGGHAIMQPYPRNWFDNKILANMGVYDEYGPQFSTDHVLNQKAPVNFLLPDPTPIRFIDPEFYAHNLAAIPLLESPLAKGVHDLAATTDHDIIKQWCDDHHFPLTTIQTWFIDPHQPHKK